MNEKNKTSLPVLSYSKVKSYSDCPKRYYFAYIKKLPKVEKPFLAFGSFCHEVLEHFHKYYLTKNELSYQEVMKNSFSLARKNWKGKITKEQLDEAYNILFDYLTIITEEKEEEKPIILSVEQKIWTPINDEIVLYGYIDRVQKDKDGLVHVIDYKTTKDPKYLKDRTQLLLYGYSLYIDDNSIESIRTSYILLKHKMRYMTEIHSKEELINAKNILLEKWREIIEDKLYRASPNKFKCTYCDYLNNCQEGKEAIYGTKKYGNVPW